MNPIRIVPWKNLGQPYCPLCFGEIVKSDFSSKVYRCSECGQLFTAPEDMTDDDPNIIYFTMRVYFRYPHLKNFIMHAAYNPKTNNLVQDITCVINGIVTHVDAKSFDLNEFFCYSNITSLLHIDTSGYSPTSGRETIHLILYIKGVTQEIHGNFSLIEIIPKLDVLYNMMFSICHKLVQNAIGKANEYRTVVI